MLKKLLLSPYYLILAIRNFLYDSGIKKSEKADVPTICVGNVTVGGTGKTPHVEMILRLLSESDVWSTEKTAVLSRGYKRRKKGFNIVPADGSALDFGDEPVQIKKNFPATTVAVDKNRIEGCRILSDPSSPERASLIILDDAFQYRKLKADLDIVLIDYSRPVFQDVLIPFGNLRDLPGRIRKADILIVTKCPYELDDEEKKEYSKKLGFVSYDPSSTEGKMKDGKKRKLLFTIIRYQTCKPVFKESDPHYIYSKNLILFTGIARDSQLVGHLSENYHIIKYLNFPDHHRYTASDFREIESMVKKNPTAAVATTEKDAQRVLDFGKLAPCVKERIFMAPIRVDFFSDEERDCFIETLDSLKR